MRCVRTPPAESTLLTCEPQANSVYTILKDKGSHLSFEKEYYDIVRAGMLKWR